VDAHGARVTFVHYVPVWVQHPSLVVLPVGRGCRLIRRTRRSCALPTRARSPQQAAQRRCSPFPHTCPNARGVNHQRAPRTRGCSISGAGARASR
jgi:hypothetical protein